MKTPTSSRSVFGDMVGDEMWTGSYGLGPASQVKRTSPKSALIQRPVCG